MALSKTKQRYLDWQTTVAQWRLEYKTPLNFNMTNVVTVRKCIRCGSKNRLHRHHKGHEYLFATILPSEYAKRYIEFKAEDLVVLCNNCHKKIHRKYNEIINEMFLVISTGDYDRENTVVDKEFLEPYRLKLVAICDKWLKRKIK